MSKVLVAVAGVATVTGAVVAGMAVWLLLAALAALPLSWLVMLMLGAAFSPGPSFLLTWGGVTLFLLAVGQLRSVFRRN